jgi:Tfp pilus assembly protein FimT
MKNIFSIGLVIALLIPGFSWAQQDANKTAADVPKDTKTIKGIEKIVGTWKLQSTDSNNKNNANTNSAASRDQDASVSGNAFETIKFGPDGRYTTSGGQARTSDEGSYRFNETRSVLYLQSDGGQTPTEWNVAFQGHSLTLTSDEGSDRAKKSKYVYNKVKEGVSTTKDQ